MIIDNAAKSLGIADASGFVDTYRKLYLKYEAAVGPIVSDPAKLADLLYNEVYAKLDPAAYAAK